MQYSLNCKGALVNISQPVVMGIINATPDSFYTSSQVHTVQAAVTQATLMLQQGATILDVGGQTSKPGSQPISTQQEIDRVVPVIAAIKTEFPEAILSVDTYRAAVACEAIAAGASMVNDISGGLLDADMLTTVAALKVPYIAMHMQGNPSTMQQNPSYQNIVTDILEFFAERLTVYEQLGITDVVLDVGFGFGKTLEHNYQLANQFSCFAALRKPLLAGVSRKSMLYKPLQTKPENSLYATTAMHLFLLQQGAHILRVHDVEPAVHTIKIWEQLQKNRAAQH